MTAVVRVKRFLDEEPSSGLILSCKRRKTDENDEDAVKTLFTFAGTVKDQKENVALITPDKLIKPDVKSASRPAPNVSEKVRVDTKKSSQTNRFKLVNYFRAIGDTEENCSKDAGNQSGVTVLDVEADQTNKEVTENKGKDSAEKPISSQYVYDLYYIQPDAKEIDLDDLLLDGLVSFVPVENELVFETYRSNKATDGDSGDDSPLMDDDDDSNDEGNWRNDYPDEEEGADSDEEHDWLASRVSKLKFGDEELSSDSDDERLLCADGLDPTDVKLYGLKYAFYKKSILEERRSSPLVNSSHGSDVDSISNEDSDSE